jgi:hypothetical protein
MSAREYFVILDDIAQAGSATELLPIARELRERNDLTDHERKQLQDKINRQLLKITPKA